MVGDVLRLTGQRRTAASDGSNPRLAPGRLGWPMYASIVGEAASDRSMTGEEQRNLSKDRGIAFRSFHFAGRDESVNMVGRDTLVDSCGGLSKREGGG